MVRISSAALTVTAGMWGIAGLSQAQARRRETDIVPAFISSAIAISTTPASGFVASDSSVTFALNIPQADTSNDLYFTLAGPSSSSWIVSCAHSGDSREDCIGDSWIDADGW